MVFLRVMICAGLWAAQPAFADPAQTLGVGRLFTNDYLGDGHDRWQSGSYVMSVLRGPADWDGTPQPFGTLQEIRLRSAIIASDGLGPAPGDRPYVGALSLGVHSHFGAGNTRATLGVDVTAIGPQTGLSRFQEQAHERFNMPQVRFIESEADNDVILGATAETAEAIRLSPDITARPFGEVQIGGEDAVRVGADVFIGADVASDVLVRDVTTGQLYPSTDRADASGFAFVLGADMAAVADSLFLPGNGEGAALPSRTRVRAGLHWRGDDNTRVFYGLTYLSPEFEGQDEGQITGSVTFKINF